MVHPAVHTVRTKQSHSLIPPSRPSSWLTVLSFPRRSPTGAYSEWIPLILSHIRPVRSSRRPSVRIDIGPNGPACPCQPQPAISCRLARRSRPTVSGLLIDFLPGRYCWPRVIAALANHQLWMVCALGFSPMRQSVPQHDPTHNPMEMSKSQSKM